MNPFNKNKTLYSMWPITVAMLNLPRQIHYLFGRLLMVGIIPGDYAFYSIDHCKRQLIHVGDHVIMIKIG